MCNDSDNLINWPYVSLFSGREQTRSEFDHRYVTSFIDQSDHRKLGQNLTVYLQGTYRREDRQVKVTIYQPITAQETKSMCHSIFTGGGEQACTGYNLSTNQITRNQVNMKQYTYRWWGAGRQWGRHRPVGLTIYTVHGVVTGGTARVLFVFISSLEHTDEKQGRNL